MPAYRDPKRTTWLLSLFVPASLVLGPLLYLWHHAAWRLWIPVAITYFLIPLLDAWVGEDRSNPPEDAVLRLLEADHYYRWITYALVPVMWVCIIFAAWFVATQAVPAHGILAVTISTGMMGGFCINVGHELGHKRTFLEQTLAKLVLAPTAYGHFYVEHNRGHHRDVATLLPIRLRPGWANRFMRLPAASCRAPGSVRGGWNGSAWAARRGNGATRCCSRWR
ncbi:hypothetical protein LP419_15825 [Massilia sp. H-1]|nr:hypothetical protein LP419_15825 [Massilia sp. H-1]